MITVNSLSGGKTSSYIAMNYKADFNVFSVVCIDDIRCKVKDDYVLKYAKNKLEKFTPEFGEFIATAEDDRTLKAMIDLEQLMGKEITWVRGASFDRVIDEGTKTRLPSWARRYCTTQMKLLPIFLWWFNNVSVKCRMNIGFRFDEYDRQERFFNNSTPTEFKIPISCDTRGQRRQKFESFNWRYCHFPLVKDGIKKHHIEDYWSKHGRIVGNLFEEERFIDFPAVSNCIGCFHKSPETLAAMSEINREKFIWFIDQELKGKGRWLDEVITYQHIMDNYKDIAKEVLFEIKYLNQSCDTGGCTDD